MDRDTAIRGIRNELTELNERFTERHTELRASLARLNLRVAQLEKRQAETELSLRTELENIVLLLHERLDDS